MRFELSTQPFRFIPSLALAALAFSASPSAHAHFILNDPPAADTDTVGGKGAPPCGPTSASGVVTPMTGGSEMNLDLSETVLHAGYYRVALATSRETLPEDPLVTTTTGDPTTGNSVSAAMMNPVVAPVLADDVFDHTSGTTPIHFQTTVKLPNINCDKCTLQVIEFMAGHGYNGPVGQGGGFFYHHCADLKITADPSLALETWPAAAGGTPTTGQGGSAQGSAGSAATASGGSSMTSTGGSSAGGSSSAGAAGSSSAGSSSTSSAGSDSGDDSGGCTVSNRAPSSRSSAVAVALLGFACSLWRRRSAR
jgi:hypothetical protein